MDTRSATGNDTSCLSGSPSTLRRKKKNTRSPKFITDMTNGKINKPCLRLFTVQLFTGTCLYTRTGPGTCGPEPRSAAFESLFIVHGSSPARCIPLPEVPDTAHSKHVLSPLQGVQAGNETKARRYSFLVYYDDVWLLRDRDTSGGGWHCCSWYITKLASVVTCCSHIALR